MRAVPADSCYVTFGSGNACDIHTVIEVVSESFRVCGPQLVSVGSGQVLDKCKNVEYQTVLV